MVDPNQLLMGFVVGFMAGIFVAYKLAQRMKNKDLGTNWPPKQHSERQVAREVSPDQIVWEKKK